MLTKVNLRHALLTRRAQLTSAEVAEKSSTIARYVGILPAFRMSHTVMVYLALAQEVQTTQIIACARQCQKRIVVPRLVGNTLLVMPLPEEPAQLRYNRFGILEPDGTLDSVPLEDIGYVAIPGVAFDRQGGRLGFGKGYYDRFCQQLPATTHRSGLAFDLQVLPHVPQEAHDVCMHSIVTEQGAILCGHSLPAAE